MSENGTEVEKGKRDFAKFNCFEMCAICATGKSQPSRPRGNSRKVTTLERLYRRDYPRFFTYGSSVQVVRVFAGAPLYSRLQTNSKS